MHTAVGEVEKGKLTLVSGGPATGKTKKLTEAAISLAQEGWFIVYVCCDEHVVSIGRKIPDGLEGQFRIIQGKVTPGYITEVIQICENEKPDVLVISGYPIGVNDLRLLHDAGMRLKMAVLPTQQTPRKTLG